MALKLEEIVPVLREAKIDPKIITSIETRLEEIQADKKEDRSESAPKGKNEFVIIVRGDAALKKTVQQGWVVQVKKGTDIQMLPEIMKGITSDNNAGQKRKKNPVKTWRDFFMHVKRKWLKNKDVHVKTKEPVQVVVLETEEI